MGVELGPFFFWFSVLKPQVLRLSGPEEVARAVQGCPAADSSDISIIKAIFKP